MAKHKHAEIIKQWADDQTKIVEWRHYDSEEWQRVEKPSWLGDAQYRIKPERVYPETKMELFELAQASGLDRVELELSIVFRLVANAALKHAIDAGQVVPTEDANANAFEHFNRGTKHRADRDMAIAKAVRDACVATIARFINIPGNLIFVPDLAVVIATVK